MQWLQMLFLHFQFGMMPQDGAMMDANIFSAGAQGGAKEIIECKDCILYPPNPNMSTPSTRKRPPGCKTIFVGGLPEKTTGQSSFSFACFLSF